MPIRLGDARRRRNLHRHVERRDVFLERRHRTGGGAIGLHVRHAKALRVVTWFSAQVPSPVKPLNFA